MKIITGIIIGGLLVWAFSLPTVTPTVANNYIDENINSNVQVFQYGNVTCLTWKHGYGGGMSCLPTKDI